MNCALVFKKVIESYLIADIASGNSKCKLMAHEACEQDSCLLWSLTCGDWGHAEGVVSLKRRVGEQRPSEEELECENRARLATVLFLESLQPQSLPLLSSHAFCMCWVE